MDIQELLKPRYRVIADYPDSIYPVGFVLELDTNAFQDQRNDAICSKYPHLFKKLEWWEERKPEEMPQYIKVRSTWEGEPDAYYKNGVEFYYSDDGHINFKKGGGLLPWYAEPATEAEYIEYQKSKQTT